MKTRVLFLCTGNAARSQMAEAILRRIAGDRFEVFSAGIEPKEIHPLTMRVMREANYSLAGQYSKSLDEYLGKVTFDYLITVCAQADQNCPTMFTGYAHRLHWFFDDPAAQPGTEEEKLAKFREVRDQIEEQVRAWIAELGGGESPAGRP